MCPSVSFPSGRSVGVLSIGNLNLDRVTVASQDRLNGQGIRVVGGVVDVLPTILNGLDEVSLSIEESNSHQVNTKVTSAAEMVTGQHTESTE